MFGKNSKTGSVTLACKQSGTKQNGEEEDRIGRGPMVTGICRYLGHLLPSYLSGTGRSEQEVELGYKASNLPTVINVIFQGSTF